MTVRVFMLGVLAGSVAAAPHRHTHRHSRTTITHDDGWVEPTPEDRAIADDEMADWLDPGRDPNDGQISLDNCGTDDVDGDTWDKDDVEERIANEAVENRCTEGALDCIDVSRVYLPSQKFIFLSFALFALSRNSRFLVGNFALYYVAHTTEEQCASGRWAYVRT